MADFKEVENKEFQNPYRGEYMKTLFLLCLLVAIVLTGCTPAFIAPAPVETSPAAVSRLQEFDTPLALQDWAKEHLKAIDGDCDDHALKLQDEAFKDGYKLSAQLIRDGKLAGVEVSNYKELHMANIAIIGNEVYFIEPQPDCFRVMFVCYLD